WNDMNSWEIVLQHMRSRVNVHSFDTWFRPTRQEGPDNGKLRVRLPSRVFYKRLTETYKELLDAVKVEANMQDVEFEFICPEPDVAPGHAPQTTRQARLDFDSVEHQLNSRY